MTIEKKTSKTLNIILWLTQGLLAALFLWNGFTKIFTPENFPFPWLKENMSLGLITGIVDILGGIGIVLPTLLRIQPKLTIFAAYGMILLMIAGSIFHIARGEANAIGFNFFVALLAGFVAWGRQTKAPITSKNQ